MPRLWVGMIVAVPGWMLAAGLVEQGMSACQATLTVLLGNVIVLVPLLLIGHAGARYGIPYAVLVRASFGTIGARLPALMRALVACGWYGIQTWIGGVALLTLLGVLLGADLRGTPLPSSTSAPASSSPSSPSGRSSSSSCARGC